MKRRKLIKVLGLSAFASSISGFDLFMDLDSVKTSCQTSTDMLGPFFRKGAPLRNDISDPRNTDDIPLRVIGQVFGTDCITPLKNIEIDIWHCDHKKKYDMESDAYKCRGKIITNENGEYWYKTFVPPPYGGRPKHIHYLIDEVEGYQRLATQLYFKGDQKIKRNNWIKYPWDEKRILEVYQNEENMAEVKLDLFLTAISRK